MENFLQLIYEFCGENSQLLFLLTVIFDIVFGVLLFVRTKNKKIVEDLAMKYRTEKDALSKSIPSPVVTLSGTRTEYRLNKATGLLEKTGEIDIDELVNSFDAQTLNAIYQRFFPNTPQDEAIYEYGSTSDDIDKMQDAFALAENYRTKYNLPDDMHFSEIFAYVSKKNLELKEKIDFVEKFKKETSVNGQSVSQKVENVSQNGQDNSQASHENAFTKK